MADPKKEARKARRRAKREQHKKDHADRTGAVRRAEPKIHPVTNFKLDPRSGYTDRAKVYEVGECLCIIDMHDAVGWSITMSHKSRAPTLEEFWTARRHLVAPGVQMAVLIGPSSIRTGEEGADRGLEGRLYGYAVEVTLPKLFDWEGPKQSEPVPPPPAQGDIVTPNGVVIPGSSLPQGAYLIGEDPSGKISVGVAGDASDPPPEQP